MKLNLRSTIPDIGLAISIALFSLLLLNSSSRAQETTYMTIDSLLNAFSYYGGVQEPFVYDPTSNILATIRRGPTGSSDNLYIRTSTDLGTTWSAPMGPLHAPLSQGSGRYPSMLIVNPTHSGNPAELYYFYTFPVLAPGADPAFGSFLTGLTDASGNPAITTVDNGVSDGTKILTWSTDSKSAATLDEQKVLTVGTMTDNNIGLRIFDLFEGSVTSSVPPQWGRANYVDPGNVNSRTSVFAGFDRDAAGTFYTGIISRFAEQEVSHRIQPWPAISQSSDNGITWSAFNIMPVSVLREYAITQGVDPDSVLFPYNQAQDFVVTGNGRASFALNFFEIDARKTTDELRQIVEARWDNGTWSVHKVSDWTGLTFTFDPIAPETERSNQVHNELSITRTADGTQLVIKWVDLVSYIFESDINGDGAMPDTVSTTDVFTSTLAEESPTWSPSKNITQDPLLNRITWLPTPLPNNLTNISLLSVQSKFTDETTLFAELITAQLNVEREQYVVITQVDVSAIPTSVDRPLATTGSSLSVESGYPNPATTQLKLGYSIPTAGTVTISVVNALGSEVLNVPNDGIHEAGQHSTTIDLSDLPSGNYHVVVTHSGTAVTRSFSVVR